MAAALLTQPACAPPPVRARPDRWAEVALTRDAADTFVLSGGDGELRLTADAGNTAGNTRFLAWPSASPPSVDAISCATSTSAPWPAQEGVALRIVRSDGRTRAITVTKNVWGRATSIYNVHTWDTSTTEVLHELGGFDMTAALGAGSRVRLCARTAGPTVTLKVWRPSDAEPEWTDPTHTRSVALPPVWVYSGRTGVYLGHVEPGSSLSLADLAMSSWPIPVATTSTVTTPSTTPTSTAPTEPDIEPVS